MLHTQNNTSHVLCTWTSCIWSKNNVSATSAQTVLFLAINAAASLPLQMAKLVMMSKRGVGGGFPAVPLAYFLKGEVDARGPLKRIKTSAQLYEFQVYLAFSTTCLLIFFVQLFCGCTAWPLQNSDADYAVVL